MSSEKGFKHLERHRVEYFQLINLMFTLNERFSVQYKWEINPIIAIKKVQVRVV